jgi:iron complex transport system substrate-binding protein
LDPNALHQEYLTRFQGLDIDLDEKGVFVYHPEEYPDGQ